MSPRDSSCQYFVNLSVIFCPYICAFFFFQILIIQTSFWIAVFYSIFLMVTHCWFIIHSKIFVRCLLCPQNLAYSSEQVKTFANMELTCYIYQVVIHAMQRIKIWWCDGVYFWLDDQGRLNFKEGTFKQGCA